jgi:hypothetical protein
MLQRMPPLLPAALFLLAVPAIGTASGGSSQHPAAGNCSAYCVAEGCEWTKLYSCPWSAAPGTKGRAKDDGSQGYECCCAERRAVTEPCGGPQPWQYSCPATHCWCHDNIKPGSISTRSNITYGQSLNRLTGRIEALALDLYLPPAPASASARRPLAVLIHGGGWKPTSEHGKTIPAIRERAMAFATRGFVAASIDYVCETTVFSHVFILKC